MCRNTAELVPYGKLKETTTSRDNCNDNQVETYIDEAKPRGKVRTKRWWGTQGELEAHVLYRQNCLRRHVLIKRLAQWRPRVGSEGLDARYFRVSIAGMNR